MTRNRAAITACLAGLLLAPACVMPDHMSQLQKDVADIRTQMRRIEQEQQEALAKLEKAQKARNAQPTVAEAEVDREDLADLTVRLDQMTRRASVTDQRIVDLSQRVDMLSLDLEQTNDAVKLAAAGVLLEGPPADSLPPPTGGDPTEATAPPRVVSSPGATPDPEALYNSAYADFSKGNYALAVSGFSEYRERFPDSALADNALYWIGECHYSQGDFGTAIDAFDELLDVYPVSDRAAAADLKKALAYIELNEVGKAIVQLRWVISQHPGTDEAKIARDKLTSLGASPGE